MKDFLIHTALLALSAHAQSFSPGPGDTPEELQPVIEAGRTPNYTDTAAFSRTYNGSQEQWALRLNLTELPVVNVNVDPEPFESNAPIYKYRAGSPLRLPNTQYELQWPGEAPTWQDFLHERNVSVEIMSTVMHVRYNLTSQYNASDMGCASILGEPCQAAISRNAARGADASSVYMPGQLDGCTIDRSVIAHVPVSVYSQSVNSTWNRYDNATLKRGDTLLHHEGTGYYVTDGYLAFERAKALVHIWTMSFNHSNSRFEQGDDSGPTVLCRIVEKPTEDLFVEEEGAAAAVWRRSTAGLLSVAFMGAAVMAW